MGTTTRLKSWDGSTVGEGDVVDGLVDKASCATANGVRQKHATKIGMILRGISIVTSHQFSEGLAWAFPLNQHRGPFGFGSLENALNIEEKRIREDSTAARAVR